MALTQAEGRDAQIDRVTRKLVVHCGLRVDDLPATEHAARRELAGRWLDAVGDEAAVDFTNPPGDETASLAFASELRQLSLNKTLA
jgi:hypothetical protein